MYATTHKGFHPDSQVKDGSPTPAKGRLLVISELLYAVESIGDLPTGRVVIEMPNGDFKEFETGKIPTTKLREGIEAGRVYTHWGANIARLDELHPNWALSAISKPRHPQPFEQQWPWLERSIKVPAHIEGLATLAAEPMAPIADQPTQPVAPVATQGALVL
jgi:hypothetical protein